MSKFKIIIAAVAIISLAVGVGMATTISMKLSGPGRVNDSTIAANKPVSLDIYLLNEKAHSGLAMGFKFVSPDSSIKTIVHPVDTTKAAADSGIALRGSKGDIRGFNGFGGSDVFDVANTAVPADWDGQLPDVMGFLGQCMKGTWPAAPVQKAYSIRFMVPTPGTLVVDSSYYPPGGDWLVTSGNPVTADQPEWKGPYKFKVVKK